LLFKIIKKFWKFSFRRIGERKSVFPSLSYSCVICSKVFDVSIAGINSKEQ